MSTQDRRIEDEVAQLTLVEALEESFQWLELMTQNPPRGWTTQVLGDQRRSLEALKAIIEAIETPKDPRYGRAKERLAGYCRRMRRRHHGKTPAEI